MFIDIRTVPASLTTNQTTATEMAVKMKLFSSAVLVLLMLHVSDCFVVHPYVKRYDFLAEKATKLASQPRRRADNHGASNCYAPRRSFLIKVASSVPLFTIILPVYADFAPGGTLVDYAVGVQVGNPEASPSRASDNSNVLFKQDYYFKFGTAAPFIASGSTDFPKTMPFAPSQQRYDTLKKYGDRIQKGLAMIASLDSYSVENDIPDPTTLDVYQLRPMGLLANGFLASENTGTTNELLLARYYINEMYLDIQDLRNASSKKEKTTAWVNAKKACNSYLGLMNRVITAKVGNKFELQSI